MSKNTIVTIVVVIALVAISWFGLSRERAVAPGIENTSSDAGGTLSVPQSSGASETGVTTITYRDSGFSPSSVTIHLGDKVGFRNESSWEMWPASAMHPTHTVYPGSDIKKCGTNAEPGIFDACKGIPPGGSYSFTFTQKGSWGYHDHLSPRNVGRIIVE